MKPTQTSAASTAFCGEKIEGPGGHLWVDGNGKITAGNGTLDQPRPNAFSLVEIEDCPGSTPSCRAACYVHGLKANAPDTHALYTHNSRTIRQILAGWHYYEWAGRMARYIGENCKGGFRWHVSGDVFSADYAYWIAYICRQTPHVNHWIYTRSFGPITEPLLAVPNLAINISADKDNAAAAREYADNHGLRLCYLIAAGDVLPAGIVKDGDVIFPDYQLRGGTVRGAAWFAALPPTLKSYVCPVDYHGKAENRRCGPCARCLFPKEVAV